MTEGRYVNKGFELSRDLNDLLYEITIRSLKDVVDELFEKHRDNLAGRIRKLEEKEQ